MPGLVLEGGGMRGLYTAGALDALLAHDIRFDYIVGVSAGATNAYSYISGQFGRNLEIVRKYRGDKRYFGIRNFLTERSIFGLQFSFEEIPRRLIPFDYDALEAFPGKMYVGATSVDTGKAEYFECRQDDGYFTLLRATCAIPVFFPMVEIGGRKYFDGGLGDPIPIDKALSDGQEKNLVILTRPTGYEKHTTGSERLWSRVYQSKYPKLAQLLRERGELYNRQLRQVEQLEEVGRAIVLRPDPHRITSRFEKDVARLEVAYQNGYEDIENRLDEIRALF